MDIVNVFTEPLKERWKMDLNCYNTLLITDQGEGGTFILKTDIADILQNTNNDVILIDTIGEYGPELDIFDAERISLSPGCGYINPICHSEGLPCNETEQMMKDTLLLISMMKSMGIIPSMLHSNPSNILIGNAIKRAYEGENKTMSGILAELTKEDDSEVKLFVHWMNKLWPSFKKKTVDFNRRCILFDTYSYGSQFTAAMTIGLLNYLLPMLYEKNRKTGKQTLLYLPHLDKLMNRDPEGYFHKFFLRRARTCGVICVGSVWKDSYRDENVQSVLRNSFCVYLTKPSVKSNEWLKMLGVPDTMVGCSVQMLYSLGDSICLIPPPNMVIRDTSNKYVSDNGFVYGSPEKGMSFTEKVKIANDKKRQRQLKKSEEQTYLFQKCDICKRKRLQTKRVMVRYIKRYTEDGYDIEEKGTKPRYMCSTCRKLHKSHELTDKELFG